MTLDYSGMIAEADADTPINSNDDATPVATKKRR